LTPDATELRYHPHMSLVKHRPAPPLDTLVACFWYSERAAPLSTDEQMLPTGTAHIVFPLHDLPMTCRAGSPASDVIHWQRGIVHGPQSRFYLSGPKPAGRAVGIALNPGAAGAILGVPAMELAGQHVTMDALWGRRAEVIYERLCEAGDSTDVFRILEQELLALLKRPLLIHPAVAHAIARAKRPRIRVDDIRRELELSPRHFINLFHKAVGLTPGRYYRVTRFARVLRAIAQNGPRDLAGIAFEAGYADQSHLIREFREHAGMTPTQYRPADPASPHHHSPGNSNSKRRQI
jgi:AraC-like DNA-binding protein